MARMIALYCLLGLLLSGCATAGRHDPWLSQDKFLHLAASGSIAAGTARLARTEGLSRSEARGSAIFITLSIGAGKEAYDQEVKRTFWSWRDMAWNALGAVLGSLAATAD